eukprot:569546-Rhodomonas_salina.5
MPPAVGNGSTVGKNAKERSAEIAAFNAKKKEALQRAEILREERKAAQREREANKAQIPAVGARNGSTASGLSRNGTAARVDSGLRSNSQSRGNTAGGNGQWGPASGPPSADRGGAAGRVVSRREQEELDGGGGEADERGCGEEDGAAGVLSCPSLPCYAAFSRRCTASVTRRMCER